MKLGKSLGALGCALIGLTMFTAQPTLAQEKKPNIVFILVDNVGWGQFGVYGGTVPTPRIDKQPEAIPQHQSRRGLQGL